MDIENCPCCSGKAYEVCCEPYHLGTALPETPEQLMRSRYSAYALSNLDYIEKTMCGKPLEGFDKTKAPQVKWIKLEIVRAWDDKVEFIATFQGGQIHEISTFKKVGDRWMYVDGVMLR